MVRKRIFLVLLTAICLLSAGVFAAVDPNAADDLSAPVDPNDPNEPEEAAVAAGGLFALPLDELMDMEVISVTRTKGQNVFTSPAAIYVITQEDIQRSGLRSFPEILRLAPGVQVSRLRADEWAISIRGFTERFSDKLLVQIDGRTIYNRVQSGVFWEVQDYPLADIDRIEVVRGPGASLWGANAVHGIINIITKSAKDTQGGYFQGSGGDYESIGTVRYGDKVGENGYWRAWGKQRNSENFPAVKGEFTDDYGLTTMGFRYDLEANKCDNYTFEIGAFEARSSTLFPNVNVDAAGAFLQDVSQDQYGGNVRGVWEHEISDTSSTKLQTYLNLDSLTIPDDLVDTRLDWSLFDIDFQHNFELYDDNTLVWGAGYRRTDFSSRDSDTISHIPPKSYFDVVSWFVQESFPIVEKLRGTVGVKMEHNSFTGFEYQPTTRLTYQLDDRQILWAAYSRAVRTPSIANRDVFLNRVFPDSGEVVSASGDKGFSSERINSYEAGWRSLVSDKLTLDVTGFVMNGGRISDVFVADSPAAPTQLQFNNGITANTEGIEIAVDWQASETWRLKGTYSWIHIDVTTGTETPEGLAPQNAFTINSYKNLSDDIEFNNNLFFQDKLVEAGGLGVDRVDSFVRFDSGLVWHVNDDLEVGLWGQNLLDSGHREFFPRGVINGGGSEVPRSVFLEMKYKF
jgi:iron complex outermembrane receptor protein